MQQIEVHTKRLTLVPRTLEEMIMIQKIEADPEMKQAYQEMIDMMRTLSDRDEWASEWKMMSADGKIVGGIGYKGLPDDAGTVEVGYGVNKAYRRQGFASEAVNGMAEWALSKEKVRFVTAQTEPENEISQKVLLRNGFVRDGYGLEGPLFRVTKETLKRDI